MWYFGKKSHHHQPAGAGNGTHKYMKRISCIEMSTFQGDLSDHSHKD